MNIAIYGAGRFGMQVARKLEETNSDYRLLCFIDNYKKVKHQGVRPKYPIIDIQLFQREWMDMIDCVLIANANWEQEQEMIDSLLSISYHNIYLIDNNVLSSNLNLLDEHGNFLPYIKKYTNEKPVLKYIEFHVTDYCNLKCKNCSHRSNFVKELQFADIEEFQVSIKKLSEKFRNVERFRLMGGEPLLASNLDCFIEIVHHYFPYCNIKVVSNGLLYDNLSPKIMDAMRKCRVELQISAYPPTIEKAAELITFCKVNNLWMSLIGPIDKFYSNMQPVRMEDSKACASAWRNCSGKECRFLRGTKLYNCTGLWVREKFDGEYVSSGVIDLLDSSNGWQILEIIGRPLVYCGNCKQINPTYESWERSYV